MAPLPAKWPPRPPSSAHDPSDELLIRKQVKQGVGPRAPEALHALQAPQAFVTSNADGDLTAYGDDNVTRVGLAFSPTLRCRPIWRTT
jgi:hypothetical protein